MSIEILMFPIIFLLITIYSFFKNKIIFWINIIFIVISITLHYITVNSLNGEDKSAANFFGPPHIILTLAGFIILPIIELFILSFSFTGSSQQTNRSRNNRPKNNTQ